MAGKVSVIPAHTARKGAPQGKPRLRVCAYCRVSTGHEEQQSSYDAQISHYREYIQRHAGWRFAGVYADAGATGTSTRQRAEFMRMIDDCTAGKIDMVITKSISRFARNTVDCLTYIRRLKAQGIPVYFEKENINTMDAAGEFVVTLLGSLAQEESRSISTNIKWAIERQFEGGRMRVPFLYGYDKTVGGGLVVNEDTAPHVAMIFMLFMQGQSAGQIAAYFDERGIKTPRGRVGWDRSSIYAILKNEKYTGDAILQKYYNPDFLSGRARRNRGEVKQYHVEETHPPIISKAIFAQTQAELARRGALRKPSPKPGQMPRMGKYSGKYALSSRLVCGACGRFYRRQVQHAYNPPRAVWRCRSRIEHGRRVCGQSPALVESALETAVVRAVLSTAGDTDALADTIRKQAEAVLGRAVEINLDAEGLYCDALVQGAVESIEVRGKGGIAVTFLCGAVAEAAL